jgi:hypothetical protein
MFFVRGKAVEFDELERLLRLKMEQQKRKLTTMEVVGWIVGIVEGELADIEKAGGTQVKVDDFYVSLRRTADEWAGIPVGKQVNKRANYVHPERLTDLSWSRPKPKPFERDGAASGGRMPDTSATYAERDWARQKADRARWERELAAKKAK